uniref:hypothetical protein n=1 Tax=Pseudoclavibacter sp. RFBI5 TaxID=2080578 RepID=UPI0011B042E6|nr:hypothetical protein [Pseudoclavibacter sp. RFBI5]
MSHEVGQDASVHPAPLRLLPFAELQVMERDGEIFRFGHACAVGYASIAGQLTAEDRASTLARLVTGSCAVGGASAIWVHAGGPAPQQVTLASPRGARPPRRQRAGVRYRSTAPPPEAVVLVGGVRVVRADLALLDLLHDPESSQALIDHAVRLLARDPVELLADYPSHRRPFVSLARDRATLARCASATES